MDMNQYLDIFIDETKEHLQNLNEQILVLEKEPENEATINEIFRAAHSLKGMAGTMGYKRMQRLTHDLENVFSEIRNGKMKCNDILVDVLFRGIDALEGYLANIQSTADEGTEDYEDIIQALNEILTGGVQAETAVSVQIIEEPAQVDKTALTYKKLETSEFEQHAISEAYHQHLNVYGVTVAVKESCLLKAARAFLVFRALEEISEVIKSEPSVQDIEDEKFDLEFSMILITENSVEDVKARVLGVSEIESVAVEIIEKPEVVQEKNQDNIKKEKQTENAATAKKEQKTVASKPVVNRSVRVDIEKLDVLMNLVSELIIAKNGLVSINNNDRVDKNMGTFNEQIEYLERVTTSLHESVMKVRMVPIESVVNRFPRMIRDLSKKLDKPMELYMSGEETELDRTVIDEIGDPLMHLLRNSADHGLESASERVAAGKNPQGSIFLEAYQDGNNVVIEVRDDGAGINIEKVREKAIAKGQITEEQADTMKEKDFIDLLFLPSFSTADQISDVSGRGVGLDVVKTKIESLGGDIEARSVRGEGSTFIIRLPLTLAIIQALMVEVGEEKYAIPLASIQTIEDISFDTIKSVHGQEVINLRGIVLPIIRLEEVLDVEPLETEKDNLTVVVVAKGDRYAGLVVDELIGQQEIVIKSIGKYMETSKMIGGATILGDGEVALILDVNTLV